MFTENKKITIIFGVLAALGGVAAFLTYVDKKKNEKINMEILSLEKQLKSLQVENLKKQV